MCVYLSICLSLSLSSTLSFFTHLSPLLCILRIHASDHFGVLGSRSCAGYRDVGTHGTSSAKTPYPYPYPYSSPYHYSPSHYPCHPSFATLPLTDCRAWLSTSSQRPWSRQTQCSCQLSLIGSTSSLKTRAMGRWVVYECVYMYKYESVYVCMNEVCMYIVHVLNIFYGD